MIHSYILCSYKMHELKALRLEFPKRNPPVRRNILIQGCAPSLLSCNIYHLKGYHSKVTRSRSELFYKHQGLAREQEQTHLNMHLHLQCSDIKVQNLTLYQQALLFLYCTYNLLRGV